jgi:hypothetical protein
MGPLDTLLFYCKQDSLPHNINLSIILGKIKALSPIMAPERTDAWMGVNVRHESPEARQEKPQAQSDPISCSWVAKGNVGLGDRQESLRRKGFFHKPQGLGTPPIDPIIRYVG